MQNLNPITDKKIYENLLCESKEMWMNNVFDDGEITEDEYNQFDEVASAIEEILENKYGEDVVTEWRMAYAEENEEDDLYIVEEV